MKNRLYMQKSGLKTARRSGAEASVNLSKVRAWYANNAITYGFIQLEDVYERRVADVEPEKIDEAVFTSAEYHARDLNAMIDSLVEPTTVRDAAIELPTTGELQPGSENGVPVVTQDYLEWAQGYPMWRGMDAFGFNRESYAKVTVAEMDKMMLAVASKDARWMIQRMLAAIFTNASWTFKEKGRTDLTVRPLALTADGSIYMDFTGSLTTANHYTAQANAISDTDNPYSANETILRAHPSNTGVIVAYIGSGLLADTKAMNGFYPYDANNGLVDYGTDIDLAANSAGQFLGFGNEVVGVVGETIIVLSRRMPANYVVSIVQGVQKPLVMRQEPETSLQGLQVVPITVNSNLRRWDFYRKAGFAVRNPIGVAVRRIGNGSYAIPTGYDASVIKG